MGEKVSDGQSMWDGRVDSSIHPSFVPKNKALWGVNLSFRGGIPQTRPGFASLFNFPCYHPQGFGFFTPNSGIVHMVVCVGGVVYVSPHPFRSYTELTGIHFYRYSRYVSFTECLQSSYIDENGVVREYQVPRRVLIMQDGNRRAAYWDGGTARHLNPTPSYTRDPESGEIISQVGRDETKIGLWCTWAGNRLWVSRGPNVWASDLGNPLKFTEAQYIAEGRKFTMPEDVVGMVQPSSGDSLIVFGNKTVSFLRADILDRTKWADTDDFQKTEYGIGCIAPRSIINKLGLVWWYSPNGWTNLNYALQAFNDSKVRYFDKEMSWSKRNLSVDKTGVCAGAIEDYSLVSVPSGDRWNRHTWVHDDYQDNPGWDGAWMGVRPVQWANAIINGTERVFCLSWDYDEQARVWEAFQPVREDNGEPITCLLGTRYYNFDSASNKRLQFSRLFMREVEGVVEVATWVQSQRGGAVKAMDVTVRADDAPLERDVLIGDEIVSLSSQFRELTTKQTDQSAVNGCVECTTEIKRNNLIDREFSAIIGWSGAAGLDGIQVWGTDGIDDTFEGKVEQDETVSKRVTSVGCNAGNPFPVYYAEATATAECPIDTVGDSVTETAVAVSIISQADANRRAAGKALLKARGYLVCAEDAVLLDEDDVALLDEDDAALTGT